MGQQLLDCVVSPAGRWGQINEAKGTYCLWTGQPYLCVSNNWLVHFNIRLIQYFVLYPKVEEDSPVFVRGRGEKSLVQGEALEQGMKGWSGLWSRIEAEEEREWCEAGASYISELIISPGMQGGVSLKDAQMIEIGKARRPSWPVWKKTDNVLAEEQLETTIVPVSDMTRLPLLGGPLGWQCSRAKRRQGRKPLHPAWQNLKFFVHSWPLLVCLMKLILAVLHARPSLHHWVIFWSGGRALVYIVDCEGTESWKRMRKGRWQNSRASQWRSLYLP